MLGSISTDLGKLTNIELVPRKGAESNEEITTLQQEANCRGFVTTGFQYGRIMAYNPGRQTVDPA